jgi:hypothetical protein
MKYFTFDLWKKLQTCSWEDSVHLQWKQCADMYFNQLETFKSKLNQETYDALKSSVLHDQIVKAIHIDSTNSIRMILIDRGDSEKQSTLSFEEVASLTWCSSKLSGMNPGLQLEWGYEELHGDLQQLCLDVLFSNGSELSLRFRKLNFLAGCYA